MSKKQYTPLLGENFEDSSTASSEEGYQQGVSCSINADPTRNIQSKRAFMSKESYQEGLPRPITFADKDLNVNETDKSSQFSDSFERSLKSVSDYGGVTDGQFSFVSTVSYLCVCACPINMHAILASETIGSPSLDI